MINVKIELTCDNCGNKTTVERKDLNFGATLILPDSWITTGGAFLKPGETALHFCSQGCYDDYNASSKGDTARVKITD